MTPLTAAQGDQIETDLRLVLAAPMPRELRGQIAGRIEAHTLSMEIKHSAVMACIDVAWLVFSGWLRDRPADLAPEAR